MNQLTATALSVLSALSSLPPSFTLLRAREQAVNPEANVAKMTVPTERLKALRPDDQVIVSYPRSGNTWVRHLLRDVIVMERPELPYPELRELLPKIHQVGSPNERLIAEQFGLPTLILKSHNLYDLGSRRFVYIIRNPADSLVSYYHFHRLQEAEPHHSTASVDAFCLTMVHGWVHHVQVALERHRRTPSEVLLVTYEDLLANGSFELRRIVDFLGLQASDETLSQALERNTFAKLRANEETRRGASNEYFFRKGRANSAREELTEETLRRISAIALETYQTAISSIAASRLCTPTYC